VIVRARGYLQPSAMPAPSPRPRSITAALVAAAALVSSGLGTGCATRGEPLRSPEIISFVTYYGGDPVGGPMVEGAAVSLSLREEDAIRVSMDLLMVQSAIPESAEPLPEHVRLILGAGGPEPTGAHPRVLLGARLLAGEEGKRVVKELAALPADRRVRMEFLEGLSMPGVATRMTAVFAQSVEFDEEELVDRQFGVELWQESAGGGGLAVALSMRDEVESILADEVSGELQLSRAQREEVLVLDERLPLDGSPLLVMTEPSFELRGDLRVALILRATRPTTRRSSLEGEVKRIRAEVRDAALEGAQRRQVLRLQERELIRFQECIDALSDAASRRAALLDLAASTKSELAGEFALLADDDLLEEFTGGLVADRPVVRALASDKDALAWRLERDVLIELLEGLEEGTLGEEFSALLLQFTGDAGRQLGVVQDAIVASTSIASFRSRLIDDNKISLESSSSAARVRAADWLATLSVTVPGYDPLGPARERREALRSWAKASAEAAPADAAAEPEGAER
jgi:hypothetical protein